MENNWTDLLKATIRLGQAYSLGRNIDATGNTTAVEKKPPDKDTGVFFTIACRLFEFLQRKDMELSSGYHSIEPFYRDIKKDFPSLSLDSLKYLISFLSLDIDLQFPGEGRLIKAGTPLLEVSSTGSKVKISDNGMVALSLASEIKNILYADHTAAMLIRALEYNDFTGFHQIAGRLLSDIYHQIYQIKFLIELSGRDELRQEYRANHNRYLETLEKVRKSPQRLGTKASK